jgi:MoaA/NifB/PqqE/SkfB family radical SAM enzyme
MNAILLPLPDMSGAALALKSTAVSSAVRDGRAHAIRGWRKAAVSAGWLGRVAWLGCRTSRSPREAFRAISALARRRPQQWTTPTCTTGLFTSQRCVRVGGRYFFDPSVPGWPSRAFDRTVMRELRGLAGGDALLHIAVVAVTTTCGYRCEHCFEGDTLNTRDRMTGGDLSRLAERLAAAGASQLLLAGGEPLRRVRDVLAMTAAVSADVDVWIATSGAGLTAAHARRLRSAGLTGVVLSLDHWDAAAHDRFRGVPGAFDAVARAARHARDADLVVAFSLCPTREFITGDHLDRYAERARALGAHFLQIIEPVAMGRYSGSPVALGAAEQRRLEAFAARLNGDRYGQWPTVRYLDWSARVWGCGGGRRYVYVDAGGHVHACPFCRTPGGSTHTGSFADALDTVARRGCGRNG